MYVEIGRMEQEEDDWMRKSRRTRKMIELVMSEFRIVQPKNYFFIDSYISRAKYSLLHKYSELKSESKLTIMTQYC